MLTFSKMQGDRQFKSQVIPLWSYPMLKYLPWHLFPSLLDQIVSFTFTKVTGLWLLNSSLNFTSPTIFSNVLKCIQIKYVIANPIVKFLMFSNYQNLQTYRLRPSSGRNTPPRRPAKSSLTTIFQMYKFNKKSMFFANVFPDMSKSF